MIRNIYIENLNRYFPSENFGKIVCDPRFGLDTERMLVSHFSEKNWREIKFSGFENSEYSADLRICLSSLLDFDAAVYFLPGYIRESLQKIYIGDVLYEDCIKFIIKDTTKLQSALNINQRELVVQFVEYYSVLNFEIRDLDNFFMMKEAINILSD